MKTVQSKLSLLALVGLVAATGCAKNQFRVDIPARPPASAPTAKAAKEVVLIFEITPFRTCNKPPLPDISGLNACGPTDDPITDTGMTFTMKDYNGAGPTGGDVGISVGTPAKTVTFASGAEAYVEAADPNVIPDNDPRRQRFRVTLRMGLDDINEATCGHTAKSWEIITKSTHPTRVCAVTKEPAPDCGSNTTQPIGDSSAASVTVMQLEDSSATPTATFVMNCPTDLTF